MPLLANLLSLAAGKLGLLLAALRGTELAYRFAALTALAVIYVACVATFTVVIGPWWSGLLGTSLGMLLGLLFPPVSGSVLAGLVTYWTCVIGVRYVSSLTKAAVK